MLCWLPFIFLLLAFSLSFFPKYKSIYNLIARIGIIAAVLIVVDNNYGTDIEAYKNMYNIVNTERHNLIGLEIGYKYSMITFKYLFFLDFPYFMFFITSFSIISVKFIVNKYSANIILSILIFYSFYYFLYTASALRQCIALCFTFYSFHIFECLFSFSKPKFPLQNM